jgi:hypothetical protein
MAALIERSEHQPLGIFDVRDHYREQQRADGLAATVSGRVRFAVIAVDTPNGRVEPPHWVLDTRQTLSGLSAFLDRIVDSGRPRIIRKLPRAATSVELRVSCLRFQPKDVTFQPASGQAVRVDLEPAVDYPFDGLATRPDQLGPTLIRGAVRDESGRGIPGIIVAVQEGVYEYRTELDGAWVIVLPDDLAWVQVSVGDNNLTVDGLKVQVEVTLTPSATWQTVDVLPDVGGNVTWTRNGLVLTRTVTAPRGATAGVPDLRLRFS